MPGPFEIAIIGLTAALLVGGLFVIVRLATRRL